MKNADGDEIAEGGLLLKDRACPDCGEPRLVGRAPDASPDLYAWTCVGFDCPPEKVALVGELVRGDDEQLYVATAADGLQCLYDHLVPFKAKRVLVTLSVYGEGTARPSHLLEHLRADVDTGLEGAREVYARSAPEVKAAMTSPGSKGAGKGVSVEKKPRKRRPVAKNG